MTLSQQRHVIRDKNYVFLEMNIPKTGLGVNGNVTARDLRCTVFQRGSELDQFINRLIIVTKLDIMAVVKK